MHINDRSSGLLFICKFKLRVLHRCTAFKVALDNSSKNAFFRLSGSAVETSLSKARERSYGEICPYGDCFHVRPSFRIRVTRGPGASLLRNRSHRLNNEPTRRPGPRRKINLGIGVGRRPRRLWNRPIALRSVCVIRGHNAPPNLPALRNAHLWRKARFQ